MPDYFVKEGDNYVPVTTKLVPEADLIAAKGGLEAKLQAVEGELGEAKTQAQQATARATTAESGRVAAESKVTELTDKAAKVDELSQQLTAAQAGRTALESEVVGSKRAAIIQKFHIEGDRAKELETMDLEGLKTLEDTLGKYLPVGSGNGGSAPNRSNFDTGGGTQGTSQTLSGRQQIQEALRERSGST